MKLTNAVALASAFSLGIAVFLLSLVALSRNNDVEDSSRKSEIVDRFSSLRLGRVFGQNSSNIAVIKPDAEQSSAFTTKLNSASNSVKKSIVDTAEPSYSPTSPISTVDTGSIRDLIIEGVSESKASTTTQSCNRTFAPRCEIYPYLQFWNKVLSEEDCYQSPLRHPLGAKGPPEELKYVVFAPDGGGWNNIRMAAETAMIFAHATGR